LLNDKLNSILLNTNLLKKMVSKSEFVNACLGKSAADGGLNDETLLCVLQQIIDPKLTIPHNPKRYLLNDIATQASTESLNVIPDQIGSGAYGTIYRPALFFGATPPKYDVVGKVFTEKPDYLAELEMIQRFDKVDPLGEYHTKLRGSLTRHALSVFELIVDDGGVSYTVLNEKRDVQINILMLIRALHKLGEGILLFLKNGIVHSDISGSNIVSTEFDSLFKGSDKPPTLKLIDFGMSFTLGNLHRQTPVVFAAEEEYPFWPNNKEAVTRFAGCKNSPSNREYCEAFAVYVDMFAINQLVNYTLSATDLAPPDIVFVPKMADMLIKFQNYLDALISSCP
jgi:serine/threonine protein kinase